MYFGTALVAFYLQTIAPVDIAVGSFFVTGQEYCISKEKGKLLLKKKLIFIILLFLLVFALL